MSKLFRMTCLSFLLLFAISISGAGPQDYRYTTVPNDPLKARIYTLDNGLKVYMTVNKEQPRIQTFIAVRVGGKNDPAETTGLAHYFEHLMFKGTTHFGTQNYEAEKPLLDQIEQQFEVYRKTTDSLARRDIYHRIDSLSYKASKLAIPNEYDKLMAGIGANGSNAYTSEDVTCYTEDIPGNQIENWAKIQAERFENSVIRGFHTELEAVYEEKNMSLTRDMEKVYTALLSSLFPHHPYGTQTVLGTQEHLKNPSITNIKNYYREWYVPNNMAICLSGDFDPDPVIATIDRYFGHLKPNPNLPVLHLPRETEMTQPVVSEVIGLEAPTVTVGWRFPAAASQEAETMEVVAQILYNEQAGLIDLDLTQQQKTMNAFCYPMTMADYSILLMQGTPKEGQTPEEVKDLLMGEVKKLCNGDFDEEMLEANINNFKLYQLYQTDNNEGRASWFVDSFVNGSNWADEVTKLDRLSQLTKADIVAFANRYLKETNCAIVYKREGKDPNEKKISKPAITPIVMNRDHTSPFLKAIQESETTPIAPVFTDYDQDMSQLKSSAGIPLLYKQNTDNDLFNLIYLFDMGNNNDKLLGTAAQYLEYLGTSDMDPDEVQSEFYRLACSFSVFPSNERTYVSLSGLNENMPAAVALFEKLLADAQVDEEAYANLVQDILKKRKDDKLNQDENFSRLLDYVTYGARNPSTHLPGETELENLNPQVLVDRIHQLNSFKHRILYYGPSSDRELLAIVDREHPTPATLKEIPVGTDFKQLTTPETRVFIAPYEAKQIYMSQLSNRGEKFDPEIEPIRQMYSEYFGGGMNSIVFQEMRESRGLAYSAWANFVKPVYQKDSYSLLTQIATQNDKMQDAIKTFNDIIENMPESAAAFQLAKEGMTARLRTERVTKMDILWSFVGAHYLGMNVDPRIKVYNDIQAMTLKDVTDFQQKWIKGRTYSYGILGDKKDLDMEALKKIGPITELTQEEIFGY